MILGSILFPALLVLVVSTSQSINDFNELFGTLIKDGDLIYNVNSDSSVLFQLMADLTGSSGSIVGISKSIESFELLKATATTHTIWERSLILHADPGAHIYHTHGKPNIDAVNTVDDVHKQIGEICPKLIYINQESSDDTYSVINALMGSIQVTTQCAPVLLVSFSTNSPSCPVVMSSLQTLKYDTIFSIVTHTVSDYMNFDSKLSILAVRHLADTRSLVDSLQLFVSRGLLVDISSTHQMSLCQNLQQHSSQSLEPYQSTFTIESNMLIRGGINANEMNNQAKCNTEYNLDNTVITGPTFTYDSSLRIRSLNQIADSVCIIWAHSLALANTSRSIEAQQNCVSFAKYRFHIIRTMLMRRRLGYDSRAGINEKQYMHYKTTNNTSITTQSTRKLNQQSLITDMFDRSAPFEMQMNADHCAEPIWCAHTVEIQRRLHAWQFPSEDVLVRDDFINYSDTTEVDNDKVGGKSNTHGYDSSNSKTQDHCTNAKFLVYEPLSDVHGIGSMLQMTVAAFRYAICLDRVFILSPKSIVHGTLTKWRHPGCEGTTTFECFFQPLSSCSSSISEPDISVAMKRHNGSTFSTDGFKFDSYPLRNERILVLHGIPVYGPCAICQSEWPASSRFWDGLYTGGELLPHMKLDLELQHTRAFMGTMKFTYGSQLLRFLLRPRPWFQEALREIIQLSMVSPITSGDSGDSGAAESGAHVNVNNVGDDSVLNDNTLDSRDEIRRRGSNQLLKSEQFPRFFSSVHVRFGMKVAEVELRPLTRYMAILSYKLPFVKDIFLSTETQDVIQTLIREYPDYRFHYLDYTRHEYIHLQAIENTVHMLEDDDNDDDETCKEKNNNDDEIDSESESKGESEEDANHSQQHKQQHVLPGHIDFVSEWMFSMANLYTASEAKGGFLGSLSSNWCNLIHLLERTRGDGGLDYWSVDGGSAYTSCY